MFTEQDNIIFIVIFEPSLDPQAGLMTLKYWLSVRDNCSGYSLTEDFTLTITLKSEPRVRQLTIVRSPGLGNNQN